MKRTIERDPALSAAYTTVCVAGGVLLAGAGALYGARAMVSVAVGAALALSNLWVLEKLVSAYLKTSGGRWAAIATVKAGILLAVVAFLVKTGTVELLATVAGFAALPVGILIAGLMPLPRSEEG
jgi:hypothetical protein